MVLAELGPGDIFGDIALLTSKPRSTDVIAVDEVDLMTIEREIFQTKILSDPVRLKQMLELLGNRLNDTIIKLAPASRKR